MVKPVYQFCVSPDSDKQQIVKWQIFIIMQCNANNDYVNNTLINNYIFYSYGVRKWHLYM